MPRVSTRRQFCKRSAGVLAALTLPGVSSSQPTTGPWLWHSEDHDRAADQRYFDQRIRNISDEDVFSSLDLAPGTYEAWAKHWQSVAPKRAWFTGPSGVAREDEVATALSDSREQTLSAADRVMRHDITGWGTVAIRHGPVVDFNADYGRSGKYGFHYWGWAGPLISAFLITRDQKYLAEFDALFNAWYEQRDTVRGEIKGLDVIWYELGLGNRNRLFLEYYFLPYENRPIQTHERMLKTLLGAARWLDREERRMYRGGNWQIMGSFGLSLIGLGVPEFRESKDWVNLGAQRLAEHVEKDSFPDGCHRERVPSSYMLIAYRDPRNLATILDSRPEYAPISQRLRAPLERTLDWYLKTLPPDGFIAAINDGSRVKMLSSLFDDGFVMFGRADMKWVKENVLAPAKPQAAGAPSMLSVHLPESGFTVMRSDWTPDARYMLINHGPTGGGHSHADSLSFQLHAFGQAMAIDSGIGYTYDDPNQRTWYKRSRAHNMLTVDEDELDRKAAEGKDVTWTTLSRMDYFAGTHHGYETSKGVVHRRHIIFVRPEYFLVHDVVHNNSNAQRALQWNIHATLEFTRKDSPQLMVVPSDRDAASRLGSGMASVRGIRGHLGDYAEIPWQQHFFACAPQSTVSFGVLLFPYFEPAPRVVLRSHAPATYTVDRQNGTDRIMIGDVDEPQLKSVGRCSLVRYREGRASAWAASGAQSLILAGMTLLESQSPRDAEGEL